MVKGRKRRAVGGPEGMRSSTADETRAEMVLIPAGTFEMGNHFNQPEWYAGGEDRWHNDGCASSLWT